MRTVAEAPEKQVVADIMASLDHFRSQHNLKVYCRNHMPYVSARAVAVEGGVVQYVPIIEQLKVLLENGCHADRWLTCPGY